MNESKGVKGYMGKVMSSEFGLPCRSDFAQAGVQGFKSIHPELRKSYSGLSNSGVTLIELIAVMAIIGILAATVLPRLNIDIFSRTSVDGAAYMIASDIRYAQECAMANRISKTVTFASGSSVYTFGPPSNMDPSGRLPSGVTINAPGYTVQFNSLGEPTTGGGGSVTVRAGATGPTRTISVTNYTGKVTISPL
jgi:prepilin-type N-terminal cleavage/methylation domain-containing protein